MSYFFFLYTSISVHDTLLTHSFLTLFPLEEVGEEVAYFYSIYPLAKDAATHAHQCASLFDGDGVIVAHAHGEFTKFFPV